MQQNGHKPLVRTGNKTGGAGVGGTKTLYITGNDDMKKAAGKKHLLFVCEEKAKVSLAKSSLFSNLSSFDWVQKLSSERSSGPN